MIDAVIERLSLVRFIRQIRGHFTLMNGAIGNGRPEGQDVFIADKRREAHLRPGLLGPGPFEAQGKRAAPLRKND